ncbi:MAG TPA: hypothetical protein VGC53_03340 [Vicinamibacteria bacterium]
MSRLSWFLVFAPVAIGLEHLAPERHLVIFAAAALAILPLAGFLGHATEALAVRTGEGIGGLLNATFGNAPSSSSGLSDAFVGVFVVAILGNAAEHATAITAA